MLTRGGVPPVGFLRSKYVRLLCNSPSQYDSHSCHYDVVIAGGGIMGCSSAYFLAKRMPAGSICVVEKDPTYKQASTVLSLGSIRQQFSIRENVLLSLHSSQFLYQVSTLLQVEGEEPPDIQFVDGSYLLLVPKEKKRLLLDNYVMQKSIGAEVELLDSHALARRFPWMNMAGVCLGSLGVQKFSTSVDTFEMKIVRQGGVKNEGWFDPWMLLRAFKKKVISMGVHFMQAEVTGITVEKNRVRYIQASDDQSKEVSLSCRTLINACGPWAGKVALLAGVGDKSHDNPILRIPLPVKPSKRNVFVIKCPSGPKENCPLVVDTSGTYFRQEGHGKLFVTGTSSFQELDGGNDNLEVDYSVFEDIWPKLAHRVPAFENLKLQSAWAGYYEYNMVDQNGIISAHPVISNLIFANGFSGHGIQHSPAVGEAVSEIVLDGRTRTLDLRTFSFERILKNKFLKEMNVI